MKNHVFVLAVLCAVSIQPAVFSENQAVPQSDTPTAQPSPQDRAKDSEITKTSAGSLPAPSLANRLQAAAHNKSPVVIAVASMADAGVDASVIEAYAQTANVPALRPDEILFLHEHGVSASVIKTLIKRSGEIRTQQAQTPKESQERLAQGQAFASNGAIPQAPAPVVVTPPATVNYYVAAPPTYSYTYPVWSYAYASYPAFGFSYARPLRSVHYSSVRPPYYAARPHNYVHAHRPHANLSIGFQAPRSGSFFSSRWSGAVGRPVDFHR